MSGCVVLSCWLGLNHNSPFGAQRGARRVEITTNLTRACENKFVLSIHSVDLCILRVAALVFKALLCITSLAVCSSSSTAYHPWEVD